MQLGKGEVKVVLLADDPIHKVSRIHQETIANNDKQKSVKQLYSK